MKFVLNTKNGTTVNHPKLGKFKGGVAYPIKDEDAEQLKHIYNLKVFDKVEGYPEEKPQEEEIEVIEEPEPEKPKKRKN